MKRLLIILLIIILIIPAACGKDTEENTQIADEVSVKLPEDDTVNGYRTDNTASDNEMPDSIKDEDVSVGSITAQTDTASKDYCGNKNSKTFHKSSCGSVSSMKENNRYYADRATLISEGYKPCGKCNP